MALHSMGRQGGDPMAVRGGGASSSSSIALLQERFKRLEKMREKREEMELLKLFSDSETTNQNKYYEQSRNLLVYPEVNYHKPTISTTTTTRSSFQDSSLSLGLAIYEKKTEHQPTKSTPHFRDFWSMNPVTVSTSRTHDKPDVDTSLHL